MTEFALTSNARWGTLFARLAFTRVAAALRRRRC
jgi:hypothetical protein